MLGLLKGIKAVMMLGCCILSFFVMASEDPKKSISRINGVHIWQPDEAHRSLLDLSDLPKSIHLAPFDSDLRFRFQIDDNRLANHVYYRLTGHDHAWQSFANGITELHYAALPTGYYHLEVRFDQQDQVYVVADISIASVWPRTSAWLAVVSVLLVVGWGWLYSKKLQRACLREQLALKEREKESVDVGIQATSSLLAKLVDECQSSLILMASDYLLHQDVTPARRGFERLQALVEQLQYYSPEESNANPQIPIILRSWLLPRLDWHFRQAKLNRDTLHIVMIPDAVVTLNNELLEQCLRALISNIQVSTPTDSELSFLCMLDHVAGMLVCRIMYSSAGAKWDDESMQDFISELLLQRLAKSGGYLKYINDHDGCYGWELAVPASWRLLQGALSDCSQIVVPIASPDAPIVLIVESDPDMSHLLLAWLGDAYRLLFSASIQGALERIEHESIDLVLSSARWLPDGEPRDLLYQCKETPETSHIPFILCCANDCNLDASGLADDYLSLPLTPTMLSLRLQALLDNRQRVRAWLKDHLTFGELGETTETDKPKASTNNIDGGERQFSDELYQQSCQLLVQGTLSVEALAEQMNISSRTLQRKIQALFGINYSEYVRKIQMQLVVNELDNGSTVKMAARVAGFRDQAYLTRVFRQKFNMSPTEYRNQHLVEIEKTNVTQ